MEQPTQLFRLGLARCIPLAVATLLVNAAWASTLAYSAVISVKVEEPCADDSISWPQLVEVTAPDGLKIGFTVKARALTAPE